jgi:polar amino acid transport system substrate-binding protein
MRELVRSSVALDLRAILSLSLLAALFSSPPCPAAEEGGLLKELAPKGTLRVGIAVAPVGSAFWATRDDVTGEPRGVTVDLGRALAAGLGIPLELIVFPNSGEMTEAASRDRWDVAFMPVDDERKRLVEFGPAYYLFESTYLVRPGSPIDAIARVDQAGTRVAVIGGTTTARAAARSLKSATLVPVHTVAEIETLLKAGRADAAALSRESLAGLVARIPGSRVLGGSFHSTAVAVAVPKGRPAALAYVTGYVERALASGAVQRALDDAGIPGRAAPVPSQKR